MKRPGLTGALGLGYLIVSATFYSGPEAAARAGRKEEGFRSRPG